MKSRITASMLAGLFMVAAPGAGSTASLAGNKGDIRFYPYVSGSLMEPCTKAYKAYVAASGHSAYASTPYARVRSLYIVCGSRLNAPSQKAAEEGALKSCQAGLNGHKFTTAGRCEIAASK